jgi:hypothetical protein
MNDDSRIYVDAGQPATLNDGAGKLTDCATLQEAVLAWHALPSAQKIRATVKVIGGPVYTAHQVDRLHYGPKPARLSERLVHWKRQEADVDTAPSGVLNGGPYGRSKCSARAAAGRRLKRRGPIQAGSRLVTTRLVDELLRAIGSAMIVFDGCLNR